MEYLWSRKLSGEQVDMKTVACHIFQTAEEASLDKTTCPVVTSLTWIIGARPSLCFDKMHDS